MRNDQRINQIIDICTPALESGQENVDSIIGKYPQYASELRPRLEAVSWLINVKRYVEPRQVFITASRTYLEHKLVTSPRANFWQRLVRQYTPGRWVFNVSASVLVVLLLALIINSMLLTAQLSIPGDPFYSIKIAVEDVRVGLTFNQVEKTELYLQFSKERTTEIVELVLSGDYGQLPAAARRFETDIIASLHSLDDLSSQDPTGDYPMTNEFRKTLSNEIFMLNILKEGSPPDANQGIELAIDVAHSGLMALR